MNTKHDGVLSQAHEWLIYKRTVCAPQVDWGTTSCVEIRILHGQLVTSLPTLFGNTRKCAIEQRQVMRPTQRLDYFGWGCKKTLGKSDHSQEMDCRLALQGSRTSFLLEGNTRCQTSWIPPNLTTVGIPPTNS